MPPADQTRILPNPSLRFEAHRATWVHFNNMPLKDLKPMTRRRKLNVKWHAKKSEFVDALVDDELQSRGRLPNEGIDATASEADEAQEVVAAVTPQDAPRPLAEWPEADEPQEVVATVTPDAAPRLLAEQPETQDQSDLWDAVWGIVGGLVILIFLILGAVTFIGKVKSGISQLVSSTGQDFVNRTFKSGAKIAAKEAAASSCSRATWGLSWLRG